MDARGGGYMRTDLPTGRGWVCTVCSPETRLSRGGSIIMVGETLHQCLEMIELCCKCVSATLLMGLLCTHTSHTVQPGTRMLQVSWIKEDKPNRSSINTAGIDIHHLGAPIASCQLTVSLLCVCAGSHLCKEDQK